LTGSGGLTSLERKDALIAGQAWLFPASLPNVEMYGDNLSALICAVPMTP
jgi:hypothetical protein